MTHDEAVLQWLNDLERVAGEHCEFTDSEVREAVHRALSHHYVWGHARTEARLDYAMYSDQGNAAIDRALARFLDAIESAERNQPTPLGQARLDRLQAPGLVTTGGRRYDELYGHRRTPLPNRAGEPSLRDERGRAKNARE